MKEPEVKGRLTVKIKLIQFFIYSSAVLLLLTAVAKFISSTGDARILTIVDPIFRISNRNVLCLVGAIELTIAGICLFSKRIWLQTVLLVWLATNFIGYRLVTDMIGNHPCPCLGFLTQQLPLNPDTIDLILKCILAYLTIGSYTTLLWLWLHRRKISQTRSIGGEVYEKKLADVQ